MFQKISLLSPYFSSDDVLQLFYARMEQGYCRSVLLQFMITILIYNNNYNIELEAYEYRGILSFQICIG